MQRRRICEEKGTIASTLKKKEPRARLGMRVSYLKIFFGILVVGSIMVCLYLYTRAPGIPTHMSPEMEALYKEHGPGEAKKRRRPDLNQESEIGQSKEIKEDSADERIVIDTDNRKREDAKSEENSSKEKQNNKEIDNGSKEVGGVALDDELLKTVTVGLQPSNEEETTNMISKERIHVAIVACGDRAPEAINSLKSFALFSTRQLSFHIFAEDDLHQTFEKEIQKWPGFKHGQIQLDLLPIQFPGEGNFHEWKKLFKPCASQRLFLPVILKNIDSVIYVDTDVLVLRPPEDLWDFFKRFNKTQLAGLAPEGEVPAIGWYNRFARHPYYGALGVNSGVMLMNLTRMRRIQWNDDIYPIFKQYRYDITWGDQDILNIFFHFHPEMLYVFPCDWNYRPDHCMYGNNCQTALMNGVSVVHGNRGVFHNKKQPEFKAIYDAVKETKFGEGMKRELKNKIQKGIESFKLTYCGENGYIFSKLL